MLAALELRVPPPVLALVTALVMWGGAKNSLPFSRPDWLLPATVGVLLTGLIAAAAAVVGLRAAHTTVSPIRPQASKALVQTGIYRFTRNPIYLGLLLMLTAWAMYLWQPQSFVALPVFAAWMHRFQILPEERALRTTFGAQFEDYVAATRRWL
jgi:protein-S-isoprenylcysteine O-methyltransferase Ste14